MFAEADLEAAVGDLTLAEQRLLLAEMDAELGHRRLDLYEPTPRQRLFHARGATHRQRMLMAGNQQGKFQRVDEPVLTPSGWKAIGAVRVGDAVIAGDGSVARVTGVFPQGVQPLTEITFDYGQKVLAGDEHLWRVLPPHARWSTRCRSGPRVNGKRSSEMLPNDRKDEWEVLTTRQMRDRYGDAPTPKYRYATPCCGTAQLRPQGVPLDPYTLGVLIGDGCLRSSVNFTTADLAIAAAVDDGVRPLGARVAARKQRYEYRVNSGKHVKDALVALGLWGCLSFEKRVPSSYLWNEPAVRLGVLQGLMDTDGTCEKDGKTTFTSTSRGLVDDVAFLARSFGAKCKLYTRTTGYTHRGERRQGRESYTLTIRLPHVPLFRLRRKLDRYLRPVSTTDHNLIVAFRDIEPAEAVCIAIDHPQHTYVTRDFIVTHNTLCAGAEYAMHLTGRYPDWWEGLTFEKEIVGWAAGVSVNALRDGVQRMLFGRTQKKSLRGFGTGMIPRDALPEKPSWRQHSNDVVDTCIVRHGGGGDVQAGFSMVVLKSYEQGEQVFQSDTLDLVWLDEEPPYKIYTECLTRTNRKLGPIMLTFTPLMGMTETVKTFLIDKPMGSCVVNMTIDDATFYTPYEREVIIGSYKPHERAARVMGKPALGSGRVFPFPDETIKVQPFRIPSHWYHIIGVDFGWDHPTALAWLVWDKDTDTMYVIAVYRKSEAGIDEHAQAMRSWGEWIPVAWPHDGLQHDKAGRSELTIADEYRKKHVNMLAEHATHDPVPDPKGGGKMVSAGYGLEAGVATLYDMFASGKLKVFAHLNDFFEEFGLYHRKDGLIVDRMDDILSAVRYARMMRRFAIQKPRAIDPSKQRKTNWRTV